MACRQLFVLSFCVWPTWSLQPKAVVTVESHPARKAMGSLSFPDGSPWCDGRPTYWLVGHQSADESPWCLDDTSMDDYSNSTWNQSSSVVMDKKDAWNSMDGSKIDRHDCTALDMDGDGSVDIVCGVGAARGKGRGYNEVYLTVNQKSADHKDSNGLQKVLDFHGLYKYTTMRNRITVTLHDPAGSPLVFFAVQGATRADGEPNSHRMFRLIRREERLEETSPNKRTGEYRFDPKIHSSLQFPEMVASSYRDTGSPYSGTRSIDSDTCRISTDCVIEPRIW